MKSRKFTQINCTKCNIEMNIRNDYVLKHSKVCIACQQTGNKNAKKHGDYKSRLYHIWVGLKQRRYKNYVTISEDWKDYRVFKKWALDNGYKDNLTIDRIDNGGNYSAENCQWITLKENAAKDKIILNNDEKIQVYKSRKLLNITQVEIAKMLGVSRNTIQRAEKYAKEVIK